MAKRKPLSAEQLRSANLEMWTGRIMLPICAIGMIQCLIGGTMGYLHDTQSLTWPSTEGTIMTSKVVRGTTFVRRLGFREGYAPVIKYSFWVDGERYTGDRIAVASGSGSSSEHQAATLAGRYQVGTTVPVRYNPESPADCALTVGPALDTYMPLIIGAFGVILVPLFWLMWTDGKRKVVALETTGRLPSKSWADRLPEMEISNKLVYAVFATGIVIYGIVHAVFFSGY